MSSEGGRKLRKLRRGAAGVRAAHKPAQQSQHNGAGGRRRVERVAQRGADGRPRCAVCDCVRGQRRERSERSAALRLRAVAGDAARQRHACGRLRRRRTAARRRARAAPRPRPAPRRRSCSLRPRPRRCAHRPRCLPPIATRRPRWQARPKRPSQRASAPPCLQTARRSRRRSWQSGRLKAARRRASESGAPLPSPDVRHPLALSWTLSSLRSS